jgi:hypothetical protein
MIWTVLLLAFAVVCFVLATILQPPSPPAPPPRFNLIAAGLAFWALEVLIWAVHH